MKELKAESSKMASEEEANETKVRSRVTFVKNETTTSRPSEQISKRTKTPLRKTQSLLHLKTGEIESSSKVTTLDKMPDTSNDDVSITSPVSTSSSSSDGRGRSIRRRLPAIPRDYSRDKIGTVVLRDNLQRRRSNEGFTQGHRLSLPHEITSVGDFRVDDVREDKNVGEFRNDTLKISMDENPKRFQNYTVANDRKDTIINKEIDQRHVKTYPYCVYGDHLPNETAANSWNKIVGEGTYRQRKNNTAEFSNSQVLRPVPVRLGSDGNLLANTMPDDGGALEERSAKQETTFKRISSDVSRTFEESLGKNHIQMEPSSVKTPFFVPLKQKMSSVENDEAVDSPTTEDRSPWNTYTNVSQSNAKKAQTGKLLHPMQNYHETQHLEWSKAQITSNPKGNSERDLTAKFLERNSTNSIITTEDEKTRKSRQCTESSLSSRSSENNGNGKVTSKCNGCHLSRGYESSEEDNSDNQLYSKTKDNSTTGGSMESAGGDNPTANGFGQTPFRNSENVNGNLRSEHSKEKSLESEVSRACDSSDPAPGLLLSLHFLLRNFRLTPVSLMRSHPGDDLGMTFAKKPLWKHLNNKCDFTELSSPKITVDRGFGSIATKENDSALLCVVMVTHVAKGSAAELSGCIEEGDIVIEINGQNVSSSSIGFVRHLLTVTGHRLDLVLARFSSSSKSERSISHWAETSSDVQCSSVSNGQPFIRFNQEDEFQNQQTSKPLENHRYSSRKQNHKKQFDGKRSSFAPTEHLSTTSKLKSLNYIQSTDASEDLLQEELFDPDYGWQKVSAV